jgi:sulfite exporter TauE/SafE
MGPYAACAVALTTKTRTDIVKMSSLSSLAFAIAGVVVLFFIGWASSHAYEVSRQQAQIEAV